MSALPFIPRNTRWTARTWLTALVAPVIALSVTYLLTVAALALVPSVADLMKQEGMSNEESMMAAGLVETLQSYLPYVWQTAFLHLVAGLGAPIVVSLKMAVGYSFGGAAEEQVALDGSLWAMPLTLTVIIAAVISWAHRREGRKIRNSQPLVWLPALLSGAVTGLIALGLSLPHFIDVAAKNISLSELSDLMGGGDLGDLTPTIDLSLFVSPNTAIALIGGFAIGFFAAALGRLSSAPAKRNTYHLTSIPTFGPTAVQAMRVTFATLLAGILISGAYLTIYALSKLDGAPASILFGAFPFFVNVGIVGMIGTLGGSGEAMANAAGSADKAGGLIFEDFPWNVQVPMALLMVAIVVAGGIWWARTRDPRFERTGVGHLFVPSFFLVAGTAAVAANRLALSGTASMPGESESAAISIQLSWLSLLWFLGMGTLVEAIATVSMPRSPFIQAPPYPGMPHPMPQSPLPQAAFQPNGPQAAYAGGQASSPWQGQAVAPARRPNQPDAGLSTQHIAAPPRASMPDVRSSQPTHWDKQAGAPVQPPNQPESGAITEHISPHNPQAVSKDSEPERQQASTQQLPIEPDTSTSKDSDSAFREGATE